jgi:putative hydrolase of the HAD superfamily
VPLNVESIVFDMGGVLVRVYQPALFQRLEARLGLETGRLPEILWNSPPWRLAEVGAIRDAEYWRRIAPDLGLESQAAIQAFQRALFGPMQVDRRMLKLVQGLHGRYRTGLLSNASDVVTPQQIARRHGIVDLFDVTVISAHVGLAKPNPAIYRLVLGQLGCAPEATVFVDDSERNVKAAAGLGMRAIHFESYEELLLALQQAGVSLPDGATEAQDPANG